MRSRADQAARAAAAAAARSSPSGGAEWQAGRADLAPMARGHDRARARPREESHAGSRSTGSTSPRADENRTPPRADKTVRVTSAPPAKPEPPAKRIQDEELPTGWGVAVVLEDVESDPVLVPGSISREQRNEFLILVSEGFSVSRAARELGVPRRLFQELLDEDPGFRDAHHAAFEASADDLEDEAWRRAHERGRFRLGSDRLLELSLRARRPWRYGQSMQVTGAGGGPVKAIVAHVDHAAVLDVLAEAGLISPGRLSE